MKIFYSFIFLLMLQGCLFLDDTPEKTPPEKILFNAAEKRFDRIKKEKKLRVAIPENNASSKDIRDFQAKLALAGFQMETVLCQTADLPGTVRSGLADAGILTYSENALQMISMIPVKKISDSEILFIPAYANSLKVFLETQIFSK